MSLKLYCNDILLAGQTFENIITYINYTSPQNIPSQNVPSQNTLLNNISRNSIIKKQLELWKVPTKKYPQSFGMNFKLTFDDEDITDQIYTEYYSLDEIQASYTFCKLLPKNSLIKSASKK